LVSFRKINNDYTKLLDLITSIFPDVIIEKEGIHSCTHKIIIQGTEPTLDMGLLWLSSNLSAPDNFLYISLIPPRSTQVF